MLFVLDVNGGDGFSVQLLNKAKKLVIIAIFRVESSKESWSFQFGKKALRVKVHCSLEKGPEVQRKLPVHPFVTKMGKSKGKQTRGMLV